jgi:hypothetical protein
MSLYVAVGAPPSYDPTPAIPARQVRRSISRSSSDARLAGRQSHGDGLCHRVAREQLWAPRLRGAMRLSGHGLELCEVLGEL